MAEQSAHNRLITGSNPVRSTTLLFWKKFRTKEGIFIIKITKNDAFYMRKHGYTEFVKKSKTKHPTYYLVEEPDVYGYDKRNHKRYIKKKGALSFYYGYRNELTK